MRASPAPASRQGWMSPRATATPRSAGQIGRDPGCRRPRPRRGSPIVLQGSVELAQPARARRQPFLRRRPRFDGKIIGATSTSAARSARRLLGGTRARRRADASSYPPYGVYLKNGELRARLEDDVAARCEKFSPCAAGEGSFIGRAAALPLRFAEGNAKLAWQARNFTVLERPDLRLVASGEGEAGFDGKRLALSGELRADRGHLEYERDRLPKLGEDVVIERRSAQPRRARRRRCRSRSTSTSTSATTSRRDAHGLEGKLAGRDQPLDHEGRRAARLRPAAHACNATFFAYGQRLQVDPGIADLRRPDRQSGAADHGLAAQPGGRGRRAGQRHGARAARAARLAAAGARKASGSRGWCSAARRPTPPRPTSACCRPRPARCSPRGDSRCRSTAASRAASAWTRSRSAAPARLQDRVVAFGKRLSDQLYVSYEQGIGTVASNLVKLDYSLSRRWSAARRDRHLERRGPVLPLLLGLKSVPGKRPGRVRQREDEGR